MMRAVLAFFVHRPLLVNLLVMLSFVGGIAAFQSLPFGTMPPFELGIVHVSTPYPGANPLEVERAITQPVEDALKDVSGIRRMTSSSMDGLSIITLQLDPDAPSQDAIVSDIRQAVVRASSKLPRNLPETPLVEALSSEQTPILEVHVSGNVPESVLRATAKRVAGAIGDVPGVARVERVGLRPRECRVLLDRTKLDRLRISPDELTAALHRHDVSGSAGTVLASGSQLNVVTGGRLEDAVDIGNVIVRYAGPGNTVRLQDLGEVVVGFADWRVQTRTDSAPSVMLLPRKESSANILTVSERLRECLDTVRPTLPPGVTVVVVNDIARYTDDLLGTLASNAAFGAVLVVVVLLLFLGPKLAFWIAMGLPVTLCIAATCMPVLGLGMNYLTLGAAILMLGVLVDDAVVIGENIALRLELGGAPSEAAVEGTLGVMRPVLVATATTVLAFLPLAFMGGYEGKLYRSLPIGILVVLAASTVESHLMLPSHLAHGHTKPPPQRAWFRALRQGYERLLTRLLRRRYLTVLGFVLTSCAIVVWGASSLRFELNPEVDNDVFFFRIELPDGTPRPVTIAKVSEIEDLVREVVPPHALLHTSTQVGHHDTDMFGGTEGTHDGWALVTVYLVPAPQREVGSVELISAARERVRRLHGFSSIVIRPLEDTPVEGTPIQVEVVGSGEEQEAAAKELEAMLEAQPGVSEVWTGRKPGREVLRVNLDTAVALGLGLSPASVDQAVQLATSGVRVDELQLGDENVDLRLVLDSGDELRAEALEGLTLADARGGLVPVSALASIERTMQPSAIRHFDGTRAMTLHAEVDTAVTSVSEVVDSLRRNMLNSGLERRHSKVRFHFGGQYEQAASAQGGLGWAMLFAMVAIFVLLAVLFDSVSQPILMLAVIPFGFCGVVAGYTLHGIVMSVPAIMAVIGLGGVLVNDSVVLIDRINAVAGQRHSSISAISEASADRLRPILITSLTTVAGLLPSAYGLGGNNPFLTPMMMAMAWGVLFGIPASLFLLPCLYSAMEDLRGWLRATAQRVAAMRPVRRAKRTTSGG